MGLSGFNPDVVNNSIHRVISAYEQFMGVIIGKMQVDFVNGMADKWACNTAQKFFNEFKSTMDKIAVNVNSVFESVVVTMNDAAQAWAHRTMYDYSRISFRPYERKIDVSGIQENIDGVRGIDLVEARVVAENLANIANDALDALQAASSAVSDCGFIGGEQANNLQISLDEIKKLFSKGINISIDNVRSAIENTVENYSNTEGKISAAFSGNS